MRHELPGSIMLLGRSSDPIEQQAQQLTEAPPPSTNAQAANPP